LSEEVFIQYDQADAKDLSALYNIDIQKLIKYCGLELFLLWDLYFINGK
jgi:hypothetical protein